MSAQNETAKKVAQGAILYPKTLKLVPIEVQLGILAFMCYDADEKEWWRKVKRKGIAQKALLVKVQKAASDNRGLLQDGTRPFSTSFSKATGIPKFFWNGELMYEGARLVGIVRTVLNIPKPLVVPKESKPIIADMFGDEGLDYTARHEDAVGMNGKGEQLVVARRGARTTGYGQS